MTALLDRLNASRRFARSVYAPHKLALRQSVPSALRAVGLTAPAPPVTQTSRSVAPRALGNIAPRALDQVVPRALGVAVPVAVREAVAPPLATLRPLSTPANPVALEPRPVPNLEPQGATNLEPQGATNPESLSDEAAISVAPLEVASDWGAVFAAPTDVGLSEPMLESNGEVTTGLALEGPESPAPALFEQDSADSEPSVFANAAATEMATTEQPTSQPMPRAIAPALEPAQVKPVLATLETTIAAPDQLLEPRLANPESVRLEPPVSASDLELSGDALPVSESIANAPVARESAPLEGLQASLTPEAIAPNVAAPVSLEVAAPFTADQPAPSPAPIQATVKGRVIEEFQARPPRNMPPRNLKPTAPEVAPLAPIDETPRRSPEEWARLLRQRFAQPGDEAFDDASVAAASFEAAPLEVAPPKPATSDSSRSATPMLETAAVVNAALLEAAAAESSTAIGGSAAATADASEALSAAVIRERSQAALQAIPEDMSQRTPRDWGMALIRRYASADEAAAIGIEAYRDPNDKTPIPAPVPATVSEPVRTIAPRVTLPSTASSSNVSSVTRSSSPIASTALESTLAPARRFVAPRMAVSSTAPSLRAITSAQAPSIQARPAPLEQPSRGFEAAARTLEPNRSAGMSTNPLTESPDAPLVPPTLETEGFAAPVTVDDEPKTQAAFGERTAADASPSLSVPASVAPRDTAQSDASASTPTLEPVRLSGATRRFLEPLVGFDPNEVSVYTGEAASRVTRDLRADAAAQAGAVLLPDASNLETPVQLGVLAHELIHAAQQQQSPDTPLPASSLEPASGLVAEDAAAVSAQPSLEGTQPFESAPRRFVPAVARSDTRGAPIAPSAAQPSNMLQPSNAVRQSRAPLLQGIPGFASEEDRALAAEARVVQIARAESLSADPTLPAGAGSWNGLPAPWERLPSFDAPSSDDFSSESGVVSLIGAGLSPQGWGPSATTTNLSGYGGSVSSGSPGFSSSSASSNSSASSAPQAAEVGRELPAAPSAAAGGSSDLEQLAKQVYDVLKRRLQSDRRRGGL